MECREWGDDAADDTGEGSREGRKVASSDSKRCTADPAELMPSPSPLWDAMLDDRDSFGDGGSLKGPSGDVLPLGPLGDGGLLGDARPLFWISDRGDDVSEEPPEPFLSKLELKPPERLEERRATKLLAVVTSLVL
jgi:hypothetical protein